MLRIYFKHDRKLLTQLCHCGNEGLQMFFRTVLGLNDGMLGMIMVIHTLGITPGSSPIFIPVAQSMDCFDRTGPPVACQKGT